MSQRQEKVQLQLQAHVATFVLNEANSNPLITITHVDISPDFKNATVYFTTIPDDKQEDALIFLKRFGSDLRSYVKRKMSMKAIPHFSFSIDYGERHRQHIDDIIRSTSKPNSTPQDEV